MSYVKSYDVGQIKLDLPRANHIHELSLLSFSDVQNTVNLSLVFNYALHIEDVAANQNSFFIAPGYKLNLQKRIIFDENYIPTKIQEGDGRFVDLFDVDNIVNLYTFDDDSQRLLRKVQVSEPTLVPPGSNEIIPDTGIPVYNYNVEYPDFSKEVYDGSGKIIKVYDKYSDTPILAYTYNENGQLISVSYRGTKVISFGYGSNRLNTVTYAGCASSFNYNTNGTLNYVTHYSGVVYTFDYSNGYVIKAGNAVDEAVNSSTLCRNTASQTVSVSDHYGNIVTYKFDEDMTPNINNNSVEITDNLGVKTRVQFNSGKMTYSYEIGENDAEFKNNHYVGSVNVYKTEDNVYNAQTAYTKKFNDGEPMQSLGNNTWKYDATAAGVDKGYYIVSGWIKQLVQNIPNESKQVRIGATREDPGFTFFAGGLSYNKWMHFAFKVPLESNFIYALFSGGNDIEVKDISIAFQRTHEWSKETSSYAPICEDVLIHKTDGNAIPLHEVCFSAYGYDPGVDWCSFDDILRYLVNQNKNVNTCEFYYSKSKTVVPITSSVTFGYRSEEQTDTYSLSDYYLGRRFYTDRGIITTRVKDDSSDYLLIYETADESGTVIKQEIYDDHLDVSSATAEGVNATYERASNGLVTRETVSGLYRHDTSYTDTLITVTDVNLSTGGTLSKTKYYVNATWGGVYRAELLDGNDAVKSVITDTYDSDMSALTQKGFDATPSRKNNFTYSNGMLSSVTHGALDYEFIYASGDLVGVKKFNNLIESYEFTDDHKTLTSHYPAEDGAVYSLVQKTDEYGRLTEIESLLKNTYDVSPWYANGNYGIEGVDNSSGKLATSTDQTTGKVKKYAYNKDKLEKIGEFNSTGTKISEESIYHDDLGRITKDEFIYDVSASKIVESEITYDTEVNSPTADGRVKTFTCKVDGYRKATTTNTYDIYKRIQQKKYRVGKTDFTKNVEYDNTMPSRVVDKKPVLLGDNIILSDVRYEYDAIGRIICEKDGDNNVLKSYTYDTYGQLIRENNQGLDKTYLYEYNGIGNITSVKAYSFTTATTPSGSYTTTSLTYGSSISDRLTQYGVNNISYDSIGYPTAIGNKKYVWTKGKLTRIYDDVDENSSNSAEDIRFTYNAYGQRVTKTYSYDPGEDSSGDFMVGSTTSYDYDESGRLIREYCTERYYESDNITREFIYLYDESGIIGVLYSLNGATAQPYYYRRNPQGDVIEIYNQTGTKVGEYAYDAWGNFTIISGFSNDLVKNNPIRYRGYYYDRETELYYLIARYYNPLWRRFISPDDTAYIDPENPIGLNLYAYCYNDPVNYYDPSGHSTSLIIGLIGLGIGIILGLVYATYTDYQDDGDVNGSIGWQAYAGYAMFGGAIGFVIGYYWPTITSFFGSSFTFKLPVFSKLIAGESLALAGSTTVTVTGAQVVGGCLVAELGISVSLFSQNAKRYKRKNVGSNFSQNNFINYLQQKYDFSDEVRRRLHDMITKRGYSNKKVEEILRELMGLDG